MKWHIEEHGQGGWRRAQLWNTNQSTKQKKQKKKQAVAAVPTSEKEEKGFQFQTSYEMKDKTGIPGEKKPLVGRRENPINIKEFSIPRERQEDQEGKSDTTSTNKPLRQGPSSDQWE